MGILTNMFGLNKQPDKVEVITTPEPSSNNAIHYFSVPNDFGKNKDLTKVDITSTRSPGKYVSFDQSTNLLPNQLSELYYKSTLHNALCNLKADTLFGKGMIFNIEANDLNSRIDKVMFEKFFNQNINTILLDYIIHKRLYIKFNFNDENKLVKMEYIDPIQIRHSYHNNFDTYDIDEVQYCEDWSLSNKSIKYSVWTPTNNDREQVFVLNPRANGMKYYSIPDYMAGNNNIYLQGDIQLFHKSYLQNSINPSMIITWPGQMTDDEYSNLQRQINSAKQASGNGKILLFENSNPEYSVKIDTVTPSSNNKIFDTIGKNITDSIYEVHRVNPIILASQEGVMFGNAAELKNAWAIFDQTFYTKNIKVIEGFVNDVLKANKIKGSVNFVKNDIDFLQ